jgi:hypothetical protein
MKNHLNWQFNPFSYNGELMAKVVSADGTDNAMFSENDVAEILGKAETGNQFDGMVVVIMRLSDGRLAAFDTSYASYAGNDFTDGNGVVFVGQSLPDLIARLSIYGQRLIAESLPRIELRVRGET